MEIKKLEKESDLIIVRNQQQLSAALQVVANIQPSTDHPLAVNVGEYKGKRSEIQNRYLWGWVYAQVAHYLEQAGIVIRCEDGREVPYTKDILHEIFKTKFLAKEVIETHRKTLTLYYSTAGLSSKQFSEYCDNVTKFVWQFWQYSIPIPDRGVYATWLKELGMAS